MISIRPLLIIGFIVIGSLTIFTSPPAAAAETFGGKLRRLAAAAKISNSLINPPLTAAPVWKPSTSYAQGEVVQLGGNLYICYTAGTSAASGGPTGTGYTSINDGTAVWFYDGPSVVNAADPVAPKITSALVSSLGTLGLTKMFDPITNASSFSFGGGTATPAPSWAPHHVAFPAVHVSTNSSFSNTGLNDASWNYYWSATFVTDAPVVAINVSYGAQPANIIVDGRKVAPGALKSLGWWSSFVLDFKTAGGRKSRTITIEDYGNIYFGGVTVDANSKVTAPAAPDKIRVAFFGSSIESGGNAFPLYGQWGWPEQISKLLGWTDPRNLGIGGTGYINSPSDGSGNKFFNYIGHVNDAINISPDIVVVGGAINDSTYPAAQITSAAVAFLQKLRTALPKVPLIVMGTFGNSSNQLNSEIAIQKAVDQLKDPNIFFVPLISGTDGIVITGNSTVVSPNGTGNSDFYISSDGVHPTQLGIDYEAAQYAAKIRSGFINLAQ